ncbi:PRC-barrel domain-containing protein [Streptomyces sp. NPDC058770]|uniref:PRC-barrel domain-containing protein n=1 Tax=unclassified Streptomyces TaxID=2593676 RepID=UPI0036765B61
MIQMADIREWRNQEVVDPGGHKIGELESVYVDTSTGEPAMATVRVGLPTRHRLVFVPWRAAMVGPGYVRVAHDKKLVKRSPSIDTDGVLPFEDEGAVFRHYGLAYEPGANGERQLARR